MKQINLNNTDLKVSPLTLGTWVFGGDMWSGSQEQDSLDAVAAAIDLGFAMIDTAPIYGMGQTEKIVGRAIKGRRDKVTIATKCGLVKDGGRIRTDLSPESIYQEIDQSLSRLGIEQIDLYQCHWPDPKTPLEKTMEALLKIRDQGKIRYIGVSNFDRPLLEEALKYAPVVTMQNQYSLLERGIEKGVLPSCREKGVGVICYGPLAGGILTGKYREPRHFAKGDARNFFYKFYEGPAFEKVQALLEKMEGTGHPLSETALNWVRQQNGVASVLVGCRNSEQVKKNAAALEWNLDETQLAELASFRLEDTG